MVDYIPPILYIQETELLTVAVAAAKRALQGWGFDTHSYQREQITPGENTTLL